MDVDIVIAVAEVISAVAVVVSLVYVGIQIRQNTVSQNAQMHQNLVESTNETNLTLIQNEDVLNLLDRANDNFPGLTSAEMNRLIFLFYNFFNLWQIAFANARRRLLETYLASEWDRGYTVVFERNPAGRRIWQEVRAAYDPAFRKHIDQIMKRIDDGTPADREAPARS